METLRTDGLLFGVSNVVTQLVNNVTNKIALVSIVTNIIATHFFK